MTGRADVPATEAAFLSPDDPRLGARARALIRIGRHGVAREDDAALDAFFADDFLFHGPGGDMTFPRIKAFFAALRHSFSAFACERRMVVVEADHAACLTTMSGRFDNPITLPPAGEIAPNGAAVSFDIVNLFRFNETGELAEEWARFDVVHLLGQLCVTLVPDQRAGAAG